METPPALLGTFDMIVCNPPYIPRNDLKALDKSVHAYEPIEALDGGPDGLYFYRAIPTNWTILLKHGGVLLFECGIGQAADIMDIMTDAGFKDISIHRDTNEIERVVIGYLK
jgi:release factor glutamine methyltransferase